MQSWAITLFFASVEFASQVGPGGICLRFLRLIAAFITGNSHQSARKEKHRTFCRDYDRYESVDSGDLGEGGSRASTLPLLPRRFDRQRIEGFGGNENLDLDWFCIRTCLDRRSHHLRVPSVRSRLERRGAAGSAIRRMFRCIWRRSFGAR